MLVEEIFSRPSEKGCLDLLVSPCSFVFQLVQVVETSLLGIR